MAMTSASSCIAGFGAGFALLAFLFDVVVFYIAKSRINKVQGGSAQIGSALWLTLASWLLLFFSGWFYSIGRCCVHSRSSDRDDRSKDAHKRSGSDKSGPEGGLSRMPSHSPSARSTTTTGSGPPQPELHISVPEATSNPSQSHRRPSDSGVSANSRRSGGSAHTRASEADGPYDPSPYAVDPYDATLANGPQGPFLPEWYPVHDVSAPQATPYPSRRPSNASGPETRPIGQYAQYAPVVSKFECSSRMWLIQCTTVPFVATVA
jgi:hypothetical protein